MQRNKRLDRGIHRELVEKKQNQYVVTDGMLEEETRGRMSKETWVPVSN